MERCCLQEEMPLFYVPHIGLACVFANGLYKPAPPLPTTAPPTPPIVFAINLPGRASSGVAGRGVCRL